MAIAKAKTIDKIINEIPASNVDEITSMPLDSLEDYIAYNKAARMANKKYRICRYEIKPCPIALHPKEKVVFSRNDQHDNKLHFEKSDHMIDFKEDLIPGQTYELPRYIIEYLSKKGTANWKRTTNPDGTFTMKKTSINPRFSLRTVYEG